MKRKMIMSLAEKTRNASPLTTALLWAFLSAGAIAAGDAVKNNLSEKQNDIHHDMESVGLSVGIAAYAVKKYQS
jgi:hypothetical protein